MYALIHDSQLILGPIGYNYRLINAELEELEVEGRVTPRDYQNVPLQIDENTYLLSVSQIIPSYDSRFQSIGNFEWETITENNVPVRVEMTYSVGNKSLEQIKAEYKSQVSPIRREKENTIFELKIRDTAILVSTNREERLSYISKFISSSRLHNFKFKNNVWLQITRTELEYIISQIDLKVQEAFDWELSKIQEIDACLTGEEVYNVVLREPQKEPEYPDALRTNN